MQYYNLKVVLSPKKDFRSEDTYEKLSRLISSTMLKDEKLKELHERNEYKNYVFCNLYPVEKDGVYHLGHIYTFDIRFIDMSFARKIKQLLAMVSSEDFKVIMSNLESSSQRKINALITLTPAVITTEKGDYLINDDIEFVKTRMLANIQKKYRQIYKENIDIDFIKNIRKTNNKPIKIPYKNINMLGNKFEIDIKDDPISQNLAYLALSIGILEKNAEGFGFCRAK